MVEEFIDGELFEDTFRRAPIDPLTAVDLVAEIAEVLTEAYACGILHGDIKGNNLILERSLPPRPRVIDLSECLLAEAFFAVTDQRYAPSPMHRASATRTVGHPDFAAPELLRGERKSAASDVYALGVVLFILLTGKRSGAKAIRDILADGEPDDAADRLVRALISTAPKLEDTFIAADFSDIVAPDATTRPTMADFRERLRVEIQALHELRNPTPDHPPLRAPPAPRPSVAPPSLARSSRPLASWLWVAVMILLTLTTAGVWLSPKRGPTPVVSLPLESSRAKIPNDPSLVAQTAKPAQASVPLTREHVQAALEAQIPEILKRCRDVPPRLTLAIDVGPRTDLAEVQYVEPDPTLPLERCLSSIVAALELPRTSALARHIVTLELRPLARDSSSELVPAGA